jgi:hypothetical protein
MPIVTTLEFPGVTREQYEEVGASLPPNAPEGILYHSCGAIAGGWRIIDVWESADAFNRFLENVFLPAVRKLGGPAPSRREVMQAHHAGVVKR